jgi:hypothetical protein
MTQNPKIIKIFSWFWKKRLVTYTGRKLKVVGVKSWNTALVDGPSGDRSTMTFLFRHPGKGCKRCR